MSHTAGKLKIVMVGPHPDARGGISRVVRGWQRAKLAEQVDMTYIVTLNDVDPGFRWNKITDALRAWLQVFRTVGRDVDLVHIHMSHGASLVRKFPIFLWARLRGIPTVVHIHTGRLRKLYEEGVLRWGLRILLGQCTAVVVLSGEWHRYLKEKAIGTPIHIVRNGMFPPKSDLSFVKDNPRRVDVVVMGRLGERKGSYILVPAFASLASDFPEAHLTMAGDGDVEPIRALAKSLGMAERITIPGWLEEDAGERIFRTCDIYVLPAYFEGMPVSILEAMAYGKPIVSTPVGGIPELVEDGRNGYLVPPGDSAALAARLRTLLADPSLRQRMGGESLLMLGERFNIHRIVEQLVVLYQEILAKDKVVDK